MVSRYGMSLCYFRIETVPVASHIARGLHAYNLFHQAHILPRHMYQAIYT